MAMIHRQMAALKREPAGLKPTGGVICAISTTSTMNMRNQISLIPACCTVGSIDGILGARL